MASSVKPTTSTMDMESSAPASTMSSNADNMNTSAPLENESPTTQTSNETSEVAESPAAKGRSAKQQEADEGAAKMLERMRNLYSREFADIPEKKRPKPPAWAARAAMYKDGEEREEYIQNLIRNSRNSLMSKNSSGSNTNMGSNTDMLVEQLMTALDTATKVARQLKNATRKGKSGRNSVVKGNSDPSNSAMKGLNNSDLNNSGMSDMNISGLSNSAMNNGNNSNFNSKKRAQNNSMRTRRVKPLSNSRATINSKMSTSKVNEPSLNF